MIDHSHADTIVRNRLNQLNANYNGTTTIVIKNCLTYDFGWYYEYQELGQPLAGGPEFGIFVHKNSHTYKLHYISFPWDTGIGDHMTNQKTIFLDNNIYKPTNYAIRYFLKQSKMKRQSINKSFMSNNNYDMIAAINFLKLTICMPLEEARLWISSDSQINIDPTQYPKPYDKLLLDQFFTAWTSIVNTGLLDENWVNYYND